MKPGNEDETIWLSQKLMAELFDEDVRTVNEDLKNTELFRINFSKAILIRKSRGLKAKNELLAGKICAFQE